MHFKSIREKISTIKFIKPNEEKASRNNKLGYQEKKETVGLASFVISLNLITGC